MSDKFHTEIANTKEQVLSMGQLAEGMLKDAMEALRTGDLQAGLPSVPYRPSPVHRRPVTILAYAAL